MKIELCAFSGYKIYPGHGRTLVKVDGKTYKFLSGRTQKAHDLKRNPRKINWTVLYRYPIILYVQVGHFFHSWSLRKVGFSVAKMIFNRKSNKLFLLHLPKSTKIVCSLQLRTVLHG
jgi:ribosomal protein L24E